MALKNDDSIPVLGRRLLDLMQEKGYDSPKALATALYDQGLVPVNTRVNDNDEYDIRLSAIGSIEKKIVRHIKTGLISDKTGQFILAYCKLFDCSSDYLLGLTPIRSSDIKVRRMSEMTGLDYKVIKKFIDFHNRDNKHIAQWWSYILSQDLFEEIPDNLAIAAQKLEEQYRIECVLEALKWQWINCPSDHNKDFLRIGNDRSEYKDRLNTIISSIQGLLYKISRLFTDTVEQHIIDSKCTYRQTELQEALRHVHQLAEDGIYYYNFRDSEIEHARIPDEIWAQLPQSYPENGKDLLCKLLDERRQIIQQSNAT